MADETRLKKSTPSPREASASEEFYVLRGTDVIGPFSSSQLCGVVKSGQLSDRCSVSTSPKGPWRVIAKVPKLAALVPQTLADRRVEQAETKSNGPSHPQDQGSKDGAVSATIKNDSRSTNPSLVAGNESARHENDTAGRITKSQNIVVPPPVIRDSGSNASEGAHSTQNATVSHSKTAWERPKSPMSVKMRQESDSQLGGICPQCGFGLKTRMFYSPTNGQCRGCQSVLQLIPPSPTAVFAPPEPPAVVPPPVSATATEEMLSFGNSSLRVKINTESRSARRMSNSWTKALVTGRSTRRTWVYAGILSGCGALIFLFVYQFATGSHSLSSGLRKVASFNVPFIDESRLSQTFRFTQQALTIDWKPNNREIIVGGGIAFEEESKGAFGDLFQAFVKPHRTPSRSEGFIAIADMRTGKAEISRRIPFMVTCVVGSPDFDLIAFSGQSNQVHLADPDTLETVRSLQLEGATECNVMKFSADGKRLVAGGSAGDAWLISLATNEIRHLPSSFKNASRQGPSFIVEINSDSQEVVYGSSALTSTWNPKSDVIGDPVFAGSYRPIKWSADGRTAIVSKELERFFGNETGIMSKGDDTPVMLEESLHRGVTGAERVKFMQFHPSDSRLYGEIAYKGVLASWSEKSGLLENESQVSLGWVADMEFSRDGEMVATTDDQAVRVWRRDGSPLSPTSLPRDMFFRLAYAASEPYYIANSSIPERLLDQKDMEWCFQSGDAGLAMICEAIGGLDVARERLSSDTNQWMGNAVGLGAFVAEHTSKEAASLSFRPFDALPDNRSAQETAAVMLANSISRWNELQSNRERYQEMRPRIWRRLLNYAPSSPAPLPVVQDSFSLEFQDLPGSLSLDVWPSGGIGILGNPNSGRNGRIICRYSGDFTLNNVMLKFEGVRSEKRGGGRDPQVYYIPALSPNTELNLSELFSIGCSERVQRLSDVKELDLRLQILCDQGTSQTWEYAVPLKIPDKQLEYMASLNKSLATGQRFGGRWKATDSSGDVSFAVEKLVFEEPYYIRFNGTTTRDDGAWTNSNFSGFIDPATHKAHLVVYKVSVERPGVSRARSTHLVVELLMDNGKWTGQDGLGTTYELELDSTQSVGANRSVPSFYSVSEYDEDRDPFADLEGTIERAKAEDKRIILHVGGAWCGWCGKITDFMNTNEKVRTSLSENFIVMKVTYPSNQTKAFLSRFPKLSGYPTLLVLDKNGRFLHLQNTGALISNGEYDESIFLRFLAKWGI